MPLPFILAGAAIAAAGYGAKKGYDGYQDKDEAEKIVKKAEERYNEHKKRFDNGEKITATNLNKLGELQITIGQDFAEFRDIAKELLDKLEQHSDDKLEIDIPKNQLDKIEALEISTTSFLSKAAGGLASGAAAAYAVYGGVMALGAASTGAPIAALSGAAAYNATLAAIGGGSLAAGGFGMAGGAAILGGVVAAPVIAIAGWAYASHAEEALKNAKKTDKEVDEIITKLNNAREHLKKLNQYIVQIHKETSRVYEIFQQYKDKLIYVNRLKKVDEKRFREKIENDRDGIINTIENGFKVAAILTDIITTPLFKVKKDNSGKPITDEKGIPRFKTDSNGQRIINDDEIDESLEKSNNKLNKIG